MKKIYVHEIAAVNLSKIYFLKIAKETSKPNNRDLNHDWMKYWKFHLKNPRLNPKNIFQKYIWRECKALFWVTFISISYIFLENFIEIH